MDTGTEVEVHQIQRHLRLLQSDRRTYIEEAKFVLGKQKKVLNDLKRECGDISTDLAVAESAKKRQEEKESMKILGNTLEKRDIYTSQIHQDKKEITELEFQIKQMQNRILEQKQVILEITKVIYTPQTLNHKIRILDNQLDYAAKHFNRTTQLNEKMRTEIEKLLKERTHFNRIFRTLSARLNKDKSTVCVLVDEASHAYGQREEMQTKLLALSKRSESEAREHVLAMQELHRQYEDYRRLHNFMRTKTKDREPLESRESTEHQKEKMQQRGRKQQLRIYKQTFCEITEDIKSGKDKHVDKSKRSDEANFALFRYVTELNNEVETLEQTIELLRQEIEECASINRKRDTERETKLIELQDELEESILTKSRLENGYAIVHKNLSDIRDGVQLLFDLLGCSTAPLLLLLGENNGMTDANILLYLGIIQRHLNDMKKLQLKHVDNYENEKIVSNLNDNSFNGHTRIPAPHDEQTTPFDRMQLMKIMTTPSEENE